MANWYVTPTQSWPMGTGFPSLWRHYTIDKGATLIKEGGVWSLASSPSEDRLSAAQSYYRGGFVNVVDDAVAAELVVAGFSEFLEEVV